MVADDTHELVAAQGGRKAGVYPSQTTGWQVYFQHGAAPVNVRGLACLCPVYFSYF